MKRDKYGERTVGWGSFEREILSKKNCQIFTECILQMYLLKIHYSFQDYPKVVGFLIFETQKLRLVRHKW